MLNNYWFFCNSSFAPFYGGLCAYADYRGIKDSVERLKELEKKCGPRFKPNSMIVQMASNNQRFFNNRPDPKLLTFIKKNQLPRSKL